METHKEFLIGVCLTFTSGQKISETIKIRGLNEDHARVLAYAQVKQKYSCDTIDDRLVICLGLTEPA